MQILLSAVLVVLQLLTTFNHSAVFALFFNLGIENGNEYFVTEMLERSGGN